MFNARSDRRSGLRGLFTNHWLWVAVATSLVLQLAVIYLPFMQQAFSTVNLGSGDWAECVIIASFVLWTRELSKLISRMVKVK